MCLCVFGAVWMYVFVRWVYVVCGCMHVCGVGVGWGIPITKILQLIIKKFYSATASGTCLSTNGISNESLQQYRMMITASFCHVS